MCICLVLNIHKKALNLTHNHATAWNIDRIIPSEGAIMIMWLYWSLVPTEGHRSRDESHGGHPLTKWRLIDGDVVSEMRHRYFYAGTIHPLNGNRVMFYGASKSSIVFSRLRGNGVMFHGAYKSVFQNKWGPNLRGRLGWESFATLQAETKRVPGGKHAIAILRSSIVKNTHSLGSEYCLFAFLCTLQISSGIIVTRFGIIVTPTSV